MSIYIILLFFIFTGYIVGNIKYNKAFFGADNAPIQKKRIIYIIGVSLFLIVLIAFRDYGVGNDTLAYSYQFDNIGSYNDISNLLNSNMTTERGYLISQWIIAYIFEDFRITVVISAFLYIIVVSKLIFEFSIDPVMSYLVFLGFGYYTFAFTALRQTIALSLCLIAFFYLMKNKCSKFVFLVLFASTFHVSALIFLPSYWISKLQVNLKNIIIILCGMLFCVFFSDQIFVLLNTYAEKNYEIETVGGFIYRSLIGISIIAGLLFSLKKLRSNRIYGITFYMVIYGLFITLVALHPAFYRLSYYYSIFMVLYLPYLTNAIFETQSRKILAIVICIILCILFLYFISINPYFANYMFMWG